MHVSCEHIANMAVSDLTVDEDSNIDMQSVLVLTMRQKMPYFIYRSLRPDKGDEAEVREYAGFVGRTCAQRMLLYRA